MWFRGTASGVSIWYVCWGQKEVAYNVEFYKTSRGVKGWCQNPAYASIPIHRLGRMLITEAGPVEQEHWDTREEFLKGG